MGSQNGWLHNLCTQFVAAFECPVLKSCSHLVATTADAQRPENCPSLWLTVD